MAVTKIHTPKIDESLHSLPIEQGGTGARSPEKAAQNLGMVSVDQVDKPTGVPLLGADKTVQPKHYPASLTDNTLPVFFGDNKFNSDKSLVIEIVNYDSSITYTVDTSAMGQSNYVMNGDLITLTAKVGGSGPQTLKVNGREFPYEIIALRPTAPTLSNLTGSLLSDRIHLTALVPFASQMFTSSAFSEATGTLTHASTDWEISSTVNFATLYKNSSLAADKTNWTVTNFSPDTVYFLRFRHVSNTGTKSDWSPVYEFQTAVLKTINAPSITMPTAGDLTVDTTPTFASTDFSVTNLTATHVSSDWQIATDAGFTNLVASVTDSTTNKTTWSTTGLTPGASYHSRVRHRSDVSGSNGSFYSDWSADCAFTVTVDDRSIKTPEVSIVGGSTSVSKTAPVFNGTAFVPLNFTDTHVSSDWQIATDSAFTNVIHSSTGSTSNKVSWSPTTALSDGTVYYARCRYNGNVKNSPWSAVIPFVTTAMFEITAVGAGGGGSSGFTASTAFGQEYAAGAGGGGGGIEKKPYNVQTAVVYSVTVGKGGDGGVQVPGQYLNSPGVVGGDSFVTVAAVDISRGHGGLPGQSLDGGSSRCPGGQGGGGNTASGGKGGNGGSVVPYSGFSVLAEAGSGVSGGQVGSDGSPVGGGGGSPEISVVGVTFKGGQGGSISAGSTMDGGSCSGGGGARWDQSTGGKGGDGAVVVEYSSSMPLLETTGATYALVNGKHRYIWAVHGTYTFKLAAFSANIGIDAVNGLKYNLKSDLIARGWNQISPVHAVVTVPAGSALYSDDPSVPAFSSGAGYPSGSSISLVLNGPVIGAGGPSVVGGTGNGYGGGYQGAQGSNGGTAIEALHATTITNNSTVAGGGGGGGGGTAGVGAGGFGGHGRDYLHDSELSCRGEAGYPYSYYGIPGGPQAVGFGETGGNAGGNYGGGAGGNGGDYGNPGGTGGSGGYFNVAGQVGGQPGSAVVGNVNITWVSNGTRLGAIVA